MQPENHLGNYQTPMPETFDPTYGPDQEAMSPREIIHNNTKILQFPDGSAAVGDVNQPLALPINPNDHYQNLAKVLPEQEVNQIGFELKNAIEEDRESQSAYFEAIADVIRLLGLALSGTSNEDLPFEGASEICSTALFESSLDMLASASSSLYPPTGMVDCVIQGETTREIEDKAYRKKLWFNYYLTQIAKEFKKESKRALNWTILVGSCYKKVYIDPVLQRPTSMLIKPQDFIVNAQYATHLSASRKTHIIRMSGKDIKIRMLMGRYRDDIGLPKHESYHDNQSGIQEALDETTGLERGQYNIELDKEYEVYECHIDYYIKSDPSAPKFDLPIPYIITLDANNGYVLDICRNWEANDYLKKKKEYFVNYSLLPSLEGEGYGLVHYAGRLAEAATAIKRQLINTGTYANFPAGIYAANIRLENNNLRPAPGEFVPVQTGGIPVDQVLSPFPYKEPSPALGQLLISIEESIKRPSAIINQKVADMTPHAPMGSVLAMLESLQKVPNAILEGFHESFGQELMLFNERFAEWLPPNQSYPFKVPGGEVQIIKTDFDDDVKVIPASNPALQNTSYRFMQSEIILNQARQSADIHNMRFAYEYFYKNMGLSPEDIKQLVPPPPPPQEQQPFSGDPITENTHILTNKPVKATITQDHPAHSQVHQMVLINPNTPPEVIAATKAHLQEHEALQFLVEMQAAIHFQLPEDPNQLPPDMQNQIAIQAASVAQQKLAEHQAQQQPPAPPPMDPGVAAIEIENMRLQQKREADNNKIELEKMKLALQEAKLQADMTVKQKELETDQMIEEIRIQQKRETDMLKSELENKKLELAQVEKQQAQFNEQQLRNNSDMHPDIIKE
jgi:hypothetical protein